MGNCRRWSLGSSLGPIGQRPVGEFREVYRSGVCSGDLLAFLQARRSGHVILGEVNDEYN